MEKEEKKSVTWLKYMMDELDVDVTELADKIGKDARQVQRYRNKKFPKNKNAQEIKEDCFKYLCEKARYKTYHHIENRIFKIIFSEYFYALSDTPETAVTQQEMADFLKKSQKTISTWLNPEKDTRFSTELQYQILNFLFSRSMKYMGMEMYGLKFPINQVNNFDYLGYYAINQKSEYYLKSPVSFFYLMQNGDILSEVDTLMIDYIDKPLELYLMLIRQFEACLRCTKYLPSMVENYHERRFFTKSGNYYPEMKKIYDIYKQLDFHTFFLCTTDIFNSLKNRKKDDENKKFSLYSIPVTDSTNILQRQIYAVSQSPLYGTKMEQSEEITKILDAFSKWKVLEYEELYKKMMHIMEYDEIYEKSKEKTFIVTDNAEKLLTRCEIKSDKDFHLLFKHWHAFFDLDFGSNLDSEFSLSFVTGILFPFMEKMVCTPDFKKISVIGEIEKEIFRYSETFYQEAYTIDTVSHIGYQGIKTEYRKNHDIFQIYLSMCVRLNQRDDVLYRQTDYISGNYDNIEEEFTRLYESLDKHMYNSSYLYYLIDVADFIDYKLKEEITRFYESLDKHIHNSEYLYSLIDIAKFINYKLEFSPEDWHLWGLVQIGMRTNPKMIIQKIINFMETPHEILVFSGKK